MSDAVNTRRPYDASRRQAQARETRAAVLASARELFLRDGYAATTIGAIAAAAGVSVETVYKHFKNKPGVVKACFDVAVVGDDEPVALMDRKDGVVARSHAEPDPRKKLAMFGAHVSRTVPAAGPIQLVVRDAAASDAGAAEVWQQLGRELLIGMTAFATHLKESKSLRRGVSVEEARDVLWALMGIDLWDRLVNQRGWSNERYGKWLSQQLTAALL